MSKLFARCCVLLAAAFILLAPALAFAQLSNAVVVSACGTPPATYSPGTTRQLTQDTAGNACTDASATGTFTNPSAGTTGNAVPGSADYSGINVGGNLRGVTGVNPSGSIYAPQTDLASVGGATVKTGNGTASGAQRVVIASDNTAFTVEPAGNSYANITTATTTTVKSGAGVVHTICVNSLGTVASTAVIYDNTAGSGTKIGTLNTLAFLGCVTLDVTFSTGLTIVTTGSVAPDITASYR